MDALVQTVKASLVPGSPGFLLVALTAGLLLLYSSNGLRRLGRRWLTFVALLYWVLSLPVTTEQLEAGLGRDYTSIEAADEARGARIIVVLGAGSMTCRARGQEINIPTNYSAFSVLEAARLYRLLNRPLIIASGGMPDRRLQLRPESQILRDALIQAGVPADRIVQESASLNTYEQAVTLSRMLRDRKADRFVLVTSPNHMKRAAALFEAQHVEPVPSVSAMRSDGVGLSTAPWLPSVDALRASTWAMYHYLALGYSWSRGWLSPGERS